MTNVANKARMDSLDEDVPSFVKYLSRHQEEKLSREDRDLLFQQHVVVVKAAERYFYGISTEEAQVYFNKGSVSSEPVTTTMMRVGLDPRSIHQVVGKIFL